MSEKSFTVICDECNTKIKITNNSRTKDIIISGTVDFSANKTITCQECGTSVHFE